LLCKFETPTKSSPPPSSHISQNCRLFTKDFHHRKQGLSPQAPPTLFNKLHPLFLTYLISPKGVTPDFPLIFNEVTDLPPKISI